MTYRILFCLLLIMIATSAGAQDAAAPKPLTYVRPTLENFSKLYWNLGKLDIANDEAIDNYMRINECDLYQKFYQNEFEWQQMREAERAFLEKEKANFPTRFEVVQPIYFRDYDFKTQTFAVQDTYKIQGVRRFEVLPESASSMVCNRDIKNVPGYPRGIIAEFSRPLTVENVKMNPEIAKAYLDLKMAPYKALSPEEKGRADIYDYRDAYLVLKIQFFAFKEDTVKDYLKYAQILGVVEGVEIYADKQRTNLLYSEIFRRRKTLSDMERALREDYQQKQETAP